MTPEVHRILFVRTDRIGDVLMNLPAIRSLRLAYPKAWITLLTDKSVAELLKGHPDLDEVMSVDMREFSESRACRRALTKALKKARFDLGVVSNPHKSLHGLLFFAGIRVRAGWGRKFPFFLNRRLAPSRGASHEIDKNLALAKSAGGAEWDGKIELPVAEHAAVNVEKIMIEAGDAYVVAVHAGTSNPEKKWAAVKFAELCSRIASKHLMRPVLIGGPEEKIASSEVARMSPSGTLDWTGRFSLPELAAFMAHPRVLSLVSADSGPAHVAWISGKPAVVLFAKNAVGSDPAKWGPRDGGKSEIIHKNMPEIGVEEVFSALERALSKGGGR